MHLLVSSTRASHDERPSDQFIARMLSVDLSCLNALTMASPTSLWVTSSDVPGVSVRFLAEGWSLKKKV